MPRRAASAAASLLVTLLAHAWAASLAAQEAAEFERLSIEHGLPHGTVYSVLQDRAGFMWFATEDGLCRYDGFRIVVYRHEPGNPDSLASSNFGEVLEDRSGAMWFGTWGGGLDRVDPGTGRFTHHRNDAADPRSLSQDRIEAILEDSAGAIWVGTEQAGLNRYDPGTRRFSRYRADPADPTSLASDQVRALHEDKSGVLWVGGNAGLSRLDRESGRFSHYRHDPRDRWSLGSDRVRAILEDRSGRLWVGTRGGGLARLDRASGRFTHFRHVPGDPRSLSDDSVSSLYQDSLGTLWVGTYDGGLNRFDPATSSFIAHRFDKLNAKSLGSDYVEAIYEDRARNLWVATRRGGVSKLDLKSGRFRTDHSAQSGRDALPHPSVRSIAASGDGELWLATDGGIVRYARDRRTFRVLRHEPRDAQSLSSDRVWSVVVDRRGDLWAGTYEEGLNRVVLGEGTHRVTRYRHDPADPASLASDRVQALLEDREGTVWAGTAAGLNRVVRSASGEVSGFALLRHDPADASSLSHDYVSVIHQDRSGALWIGTRGGLNRLDPRSGRFQVFRHDPGNPDSLSHDMVHDVQEDEREDGVLWIGTEGGLNRLDAGSGRLRRFLVGQSGPSSVESILQDEDGRLWLGLGMGLGRLDPASGALRVYGSSDGLENHSFFRNSALEAVDGEMYFGGSAGLTSFFPRRVRDSPHLPQVALLSIRVFGDLVWSRSWLAAPESLELRHSDNFLSFEFAALDFTAPKQNGYAYRLDPVDPDWVHQGNRNFANYTNLAPGRYTFRAKAANPDGAWNEQGVALELTVAPALWQTTWFRAAALLLLGAAAHLAHRRRLRAVSARNQELQGVNELLQKQAEERRRAESQNERLIEELEGKNGELERFIYSVSHDLKSPIITIKAFLDLAQSALARGDARGGSRDLDRVALAANRMHRLLDELLELSRIGRVVRPGAGVDMDALAHEAVAQVAGRIEEKGARVEIAPGLPAAHGDRARLLDVLQNLIDNAVKFMGRQQEPRIRIAGKVEGGQAVFSVEDNGRGVDARHAERIFELFERLDTETDGTGIGLAMVKRIVELHGGRVWVESEGEGRGSRFCFTLPLSGEGPRPPAP